MKNIKFIIYIVSISCLAFFGFRVFATATNIDATDHWAWNDIIGWIDFYDTPGNVYLSTANLTGYASSTVGYIAFDCATSPYPPVCSEFPDWKVTRSSSLLSGWAWNDQIGWISFSGTGYQVSVSGGEFSGWAWNDVIGWISFNCSNTDTCTTGINYKVKYLSEAGATANLTSSTFDTGATGGVAYNTILYQGTNSVGTGAVQFQFAASNDPSGPWNDSDFSGYDGGITTYYTPTAPGEPVALNASLYKNKRYFRYKIFLTTNIDQSESPEVDHVIVTWSR